LFLLLKKENGGVFNFGLFSKRIIGFRNIYKYVLAFICMVVVVDTKNVTLKVNSDIYDKYKELCKQKGLIISRQFEILMEEQLGGKK
jgi:hypothetical protein